MRADLRIKSRRILFYGKGIPIKSTPKQILTLFLRECHEVLLGKITENAPVCAP